MLQSVRVIAVCMILAGALGLDGRSQVAASPHSPLCSSSLCLSQNDALTAPISVGPLLSFTVVDNLDDGVAASPGQVVTYTFSVTNTGDVAAENLVLHVPVPDNTTVITLPNWTCGPVSANSSHVRCDSDPSSLAPQATHNAVFTLQIDQNWPADASPYLTVMGGLEVNFPSGEFIASVETPVTVNGNGTISGTINLYLPTICFD